MAPFRELGDQPPNRGFYAVNQKSIVDIGFVFVLAASGIAGGTAPAMLTPWVTSASDSFASKTAVAVTGGTFMATLASQTVTTFVGQ